MSELIKLIEDSDLEEMKKQSEVNKFLNKHPKAEWIKKHPYAKDVDYLPVGKVEMLLDIIFGHWNFEVIDYKILANSVSVHIRLTVINPLTKITIVRDGLGAVPLELEATTYEKDGGGNIKKDQSTGEPIIKKQGAKNAIDFEYLNRMAVMKNLPAAKSFALKDAADTLGNLFGRNLNRKEKEEFIDMYNGQKYTSFNQSVKDKIDSFTDKDDLLEWANKQSALHSDPDFEKYIQQKITTINDRK